MNINAATPTTTTTTTEYNITVLNDPSEIEKKQEL
jgi:hypothetical protein